MGNGENPGALRTLGQVKLVIDGSTFKMSEAGIPYTGSIRFDGEKAFLKVETRLETPVEKEPKEVRDQLKDYEITTTKEGKLSFVDPGGFFSDPLLLERHAESGSSR